MRPRRCPRLPTRSHGRAGRHGEERLRTGIARPRTPTHARHTLLLSSIGQRPLLPGPQLSRRLGRPSIPRITADQSGYLLSTHVLPGMSTGRSPREEQLFTQLRPSPSLPRGDAACEAPGEEETGSDSKLEARRACPWLGPSPPVPGGPQSPLSSNHIPWQQTNPHLCHPPGPSHRRLGALVGESPLFTRPQSQPPVSPRTMPGAALAR